MTLLWPAQSEEAVYIYILKSYNMYNTCVRGYIVGVSIPETDYAGQDASKCMRGDTGEKLLETMFPTGFCHL